ncbi:hypothetical protein [Nocardioides ferulae]|uniref:hypothetical protein n=1 Tax=Nocardioides ferulae TaxID=2340821 RepID=UPI000F8630E2|nr:hypothetical protein [Nocardioides ferulae]
MGSTVVGYLRWLGGACCLFLVGFGAVSARWLPWLLIGAISLAWVALLHPRLAVLVVGFSATAFPKAGIKFASFPFPIAIFSLFLAALILRLKFASGVSIHARQAVPLVWIVYSSLVVLKAGMYLDDGIAEIAEFLAWSILPLALLALSESSGSIARQFRYSLGLGFSLAVAYGLLQAAASVEAVAVPGLTYAWGDDLLSKNNLISDEFSKIPATYQSGNVFGVVSACFLTFALQAIMERRSTFFDYWVASAALIGVALSGSRTAILAAGMGCAFLIARRGSLLRKVLTTAGAAALALSVLGARPELGQRYSLEQALQTGGTGRTGGWSSVIRDLTPLQWAIGTSDRAIAVEGWANLISQIGVIGAMLICLLVSLRVRGRKSGATAMLVCLAAATVVDSSFALFPTWFLPALLVSSADGQSASPSDGVQPKRRRTARPVGDASPTGRFARSDSKSDVAMSSRRS